MKHLDITYIYFHQIKKGERFKDSLTRFHQTVAFLASGNVIRKDFV